MSGEEELTRRKRGAPLSVVLGILSIACFLGICLSLFMIGRFYSRKSVEDLDEIIRVLLPQSVDVTLNHKLALVPRFMNMTYNYIQGTRLDVQSWEGEVVLRDLMTAYLQTFPGESKCCSGFLVLENGTTVQDPGPQHHFAFWNVVLLRPNNIDWWYKSNASSTDVKVTSWEPISQTEIQQTTLPAAALGGAIVPWFSPDPMVIRPVYTPAIVWTIDKPELKLHAVRPLYRLGSTPSPQNWVGTYVAGFKLGFLSDYLRSAVQSAAAGMELIMIDSSTANDGVLLASSIPKVPLISCYTKDRCDVGEFVPCPICEENEVMTPTKAVNSPNQLIQDVSRELFSMSGNKWKSLLNKELDVEFSAGGRTQLISTWSVTSYHLEWICVLVVPRSEIFGTLDEGDEIMVTVCSLLCVLGVVLFIAIAIFIAQPLSQLSERMFLVSQMHLDTDQDAVPCVSSGLIREFTSAEGSFQFMVNQLKEYRAFLPSNVLEDTDETETESQQPTSRLRGSSSSVTSGDTRPSTIADRSARTTTHVRTKAIGLKIGTLSQDQSVTVVATKATLPSGIDPSELSNLLRDYVTLLCDVALKFRGSPEFVDGANMLITWGTVNRVASQETKAALACLEIMNRIQGNHSQLKIELAGSSGLAHTGAVGNDKMRKIVGIGSMYSDALRLRNMNSLYGTEFLVDERMFQMTKYSLVYSIVDVVRSQKKEGRRVHIYTASSLVMKDAENKEWMYEIQQSETTSDSDVHWKAFLSSPPPYDEIAAAIAGSVSPSLIRLNQLLDKSLAVDGRNHVSSLGLTGGTVYVPLQV
eukprot:TRINITY_DN1311_c3_g1_i1.p1 TRINITY_DN1311_c3_g1~~TRINITY_DN1311_c3_g1_i1.p1  ORF type:complete len:809 (+),score=123.39 TRINITY_DN1311_c3_g1_i1:11-2437(+)